MTRKPSDIDAILVALHPSLPPEPLIDASVRLASAFGVDLQGLFVKDINLINLAALPFTRLIGSPGGEVLPVEAEAMEGMMASRATRAEQALATAATAHHLRWTFRVETAAVRDVVERTAYATALTIVATGDLPPPISGGAGALLLMRTAHVPSGPVMLLAETARAALDHAERLANALSRPLAVLVGSAKDRAAIEAWLDQRSGGGRGQLIAYSGDVSEIASLHPGILVTTRSDPRVQRLVQTLDAPLLIIPDHGRS